MASKIRVDEIETSSGVPVAQFTSGGSINFSNSFAFPTVSTRPTSPVTGTVIYNSSTEVLEVFIVDTWIQLAKAKGASAFDLTYPSGASVSHDAAAGAVVLTDYGQYTLTAESNISIFVKMWGAGGGGASYSSPTRGGASGYSEGQLDLDPGDYTLIIGRGGEGGGYNNVTGTALGGYPDGGNSDIPYNGYATGGGGGGSTRFGPNVAAANINSGSTVYYLIAGGGGAGADYGGYATTGSERGEGGGADGGDGGWYYPADTSNGPGKGGSQTAGGAGGSGGRQGGGDAGGKYAGGNAGGGGGGGGYYGGGGGTGYYTQGGGGSGYVAASVVNGQTIRGGTGEGLDYYVSHADSRPTSTTGYGGTTTGGREAQRGGDGAIVITAVE